MQHREELLCGQGVLIVELGIFWDDGGLLTEGNGTS